MKRSGVIQALIYLVLSFIALIVMFPIIWIFLQSFKNYFDTIAYPPKLFFTPTFKNYLDVFATKGFLEAFANNYCNFADTIRARLERQKADPLFLDFPGVKDGVRGMKFIAAAVKSSGRGAKWVKM